MLGHPMEETTASLPAFTAWSSLLVLNVLSSSLFRINHHTTFSQELVQEVLISWVPASTTGTLDTVHAFLLCVLQHNICLAVKQSITSCDRVHVSANAGYARFSECLHTVQVLWQRKDIHH